MKLIIADDERFISEWLEFCIRELSQFEIVGIAKNGVEALKMFQEQGADIILTDIKMPIMGGLDLLHRVKNIDPNTIVVLLTAFSEFEYAREAIRFGADDYFIKTEMSKVKLQKLLIDLYEQHETRVKSSESNSNENHFAQNTNTTQHPIIKQTLMKKTDLTPDDLNVLSNLKMKTDYKNLVALSFWSEDIVNSSVNVSKLISKSYPIFHEMELNRYNYTIVISLGEEISELELLNEINHVKEVFTKIPGIKVGISTIHFGLITVNQAIEESRQSLSSTFYSDTKKIVSFPIHEDLKKMIEKEEHQDFELTFLYQDIITSRATNRFEAVKNVFEYIKEHQNSKIPLVKKTAIDIVSLIYSAYANKEINHSQTELETIKEVIEKCDNFSSLESAVILYVERFESNKVANVSMPIAKAVHYIEQHYHEQISLDRVAEEVGLNSEYLSRIFRKEMGQTYSSFLSSLRLNKAKILLCETSDQVQEVAGAVGYYNVSYFSTLFKKEFNMNPYEYRKQNHK